MELLLVGLSHKSAPLAVRERLALSEPRQEELLKQLTALLPEAMLLSTCNRVELYFAAPSAEQAREVAMGKIAEVGGPEALEHLYERRGDDALLHLFRVSASLDSMVIGEPQILGQVKDAFELARKAGCAHGALARACGAAFVSAKRVRSETGVGRAPVSMASAAVELAKKLFGGLEGRSVLVVGAGEMAELAARHLSASGATDLVVANRTYSRAEELAAAVGGKARPFEELFSLLVPADVVICSTASPTPIFTKQNVAAQLKPRRFRPLFMVDLAVPRDIAPDVHDLDGVYAYDVDDIQQNVAENAAARAAEAARAEAIVAEELSRFVRARAIRDGVPVIGKLRARARQIALSEVERTLSILAVENLSERSKKSLEAMAIAIINKLLHQPTAKLREVGPEDDDRLADATAELFGLDEAADSLAAGGKGGRS
ncbi:MAG: glutamyl-tRNA reductase [Myxococcales bacterium]|nr:glutamyl-tRNA reductase [Myxococcales bacterium]